MPVFETYDDPPPDMTLEERKTSIAVFYSLIEETCNRWIRDVMPSLLRNLSSENRRAIRRLKRRAKRFPLREPFWEGIDRA